MSTKSTSQDSIGVKVRRGLTTERVIVYVDGMNLYHGIRSKGWNRYLWLDVVRLSKRLLRSGQNLVCVKYFTARFVDEARSSGMKARQCTHLEAIGGDPILQIIEGEFQPRPVRCRICGNVSQKYEEKLTDVNIAVELMCDTADAEFDVAIVVSGDSDLSGPIERALERCPANQVVVAFPPNRRSELLRRSASAYLDIRRSVLADSQLPDTLYSPSAYPLRRPDLWH